MTLIPHSRFADSDRATKGARRATEVVLSESADRRSSRAVVKLCDRSAIYVNIQLLLPNIYRCDGVFVRGLSRHLESLTKNIQDQIAPDKTYQVISTGGWFRQRAPWSFGRLWEPYYMPALIKNCLGRPASQFAVPVSSIVFLLEYQRLLTQIVFSLHCYSSEKSISILIVKLFNNSIAPRFPHGNEPRLNSIEQAQPNQIPHSSRKLSAAKKDQFVIYLLVSGDSQSQPARPNSIHGVLACLVKHRTDRTSPSCQIDAVQTVKSNWPIQITRTNIIRLMNLVRLISDQSWVLLSFGFVRSRPSVSQLFSTKDPVYRSQRWGWLDAKFSELPLNRLSSTEQPLIVKTQPNHFDCLNYPITQLSWAALGTSRSALVPVRGFIGPVTLDPFVNPLSGVTHRPSDARNLFPTRVTINRKFPITKQFSPHRRLHIFKGINVEQKAELRNLKPVFQRTVNDVLALNCVNDVLALIT